MVQRVVVGGLLMALTGLGFGTTRAEDTGQPSSLSVILNQTNRPIESRDKAFSEAVRQDALAPRPSAFDDWELQPNGAMRHKRTGISMIVRNPCPPGDIEHEFALAAYNRAMASKSRR